VQCAVEMVAEEVGQPVRIIDVVRKVKLCKFVNVRRKYSKSRGRYNGLMLKFSPGGAVTVRETP